MRRSAEGDVPDEELVARAQAGDVDAYGELVRRHRPAALRVAAAILRTQGAGAGDGAEDVVQVASERAWRSIGRIEAARAFRPWFLTVVANSARNDRRARGRRRRLAERVASAEPAAAGGTPEEAAVVRDEHAQVAQAFDRLPEPDRAVLALRHVDQLSEREMAAALDCAPGTVKSRLSRATGRLRLQLSALVALAVVLALVAGLVAPVREAVADWLGIGSTQIDRRPADDGDAGAGRERPRLGDGLEPATPAEVEAALGTTPAALGLGESQLAAPAVAAVPPEGGVVLAWQQGAATLWVRPRTEGSLLTKRPVAEGGMEVEDLVGPGDEAVLVTGDHVLETPGRSLASSSVVLWLDGRWEFRLEADLPPSRLVAIARSFPPA